MTPTFPSINSKFPLQPSSDKKYFIFDIETNGFYNEVNTIYCIVICDVASGQVTSYGPHGIDDALRHLDSGDVLIGHNVIFYDVPVIEKLYPGVVDFESKELIDTLVCTRFLWPKEKLLEVDNIDYPHVPARLHGSFSLEAFGHRFKNNKLEFKDFSKYTEEMLIYCEQDTRVTEQLYKLLCNQTNLKEPALRLEHDLARCIEKQIRSGFPFAVDAALDLVDELEKRRDELVTELRQAFPPVDEGDWFTPKVNNKAKGYKAGEKIWRSKLVEFNPGSRQQICERLKEKYGWTPTAVTDKGNPIVNDDVLASLSYPEAKPLTEYMLIKKRLGQIKEGSNAWLKLVDEDCLIHGDLITNGCITGRAAHRNPNMGQIPAVYSPYGKECRALFHAPRGWSQLGVDAKALELRCLAGYLALYDNGEYGRLVCDDDIDIHTYNQEKFGVENRDISKRLLYACVPSDITTVLTKEGWKSYEDLKVGQLVLTYNEEKEIKEWKPILEIIEEHEDDVWQMEHNHSFKVQATADHRWYVKQRQASKTSSCGWFTGNKQRRYMEPEVRTTETINTESNIIVNAPLVDLDSPGVTIDWKWRKYGTDWIKVILNMNSDQRKAWLSGFLIADGYQRCKPNQKETWLWSQVRNEHYEAALVASYLEFPGVIHVPKPRKNASGTTQMQVCITTKGHVTGYKLRKTLVGKKKVFCIRTENKSFVMRQGDCITITGNCLYGAGNLKAGTIIDPNEKNPDTLKQLGKTAITSFMKGVPALSQLKTKLSENLERRGFLIGLDRRPLYCRSEFKALNVLLQAAGAVLMKATVVNLHQNLKEFGLEYGIDWQQHAFVHDEIQLSCRPDLVEDVTKLALLSFPMSGENYGFRVPIEGDAKVGTNWKECH